MKKGHYAFWGYDLFPYLLGGEIQTVGRDSYISTWGFGQQEYESTFEKGKAEIKGYGKGHWFTPDFILPKKQGKELKEKLEILTSEKRTENDKLNVKYKRKVHRLLKEYEVL